MHSYSNPAAPRGSGWDRSMMRCRAAALTSARRPCLHFHYAFWFSCQSGSRTCCTPWSVFQDGSDEAIRLPAATGAQVAPTGARSPPRLSTARSPHRTVHSRRGAPPYGVRHYGQGLPMFLGQHRSIVRQGCKLSTCGTGPHRLTFRCRLVAPV